MTEAERKSFMAYAASRGPGKRQIKPNAAVLLGSSANDAAADDDDDDDFVAERINSNSSDSDEQSESSTSDSDESDGESDDDNIKVKREAETSEDDDSDEEDNERGLICALCLNQREAVRNEEVIQCDRCGVAVHENCYMVDATDDTDSTISSAVTEPWFCEPCLYGLKTPPYCELCPSRYGAFKRSDIGGGWVHLLCALYTPGITFGDIDHLSAVSWQEVDYKLFGKKPCALCKDPLAARTGITVSCDAALCKSSMHVTCAQRLGLLVDNSEVENERVNGKGKPHQASKQKWYFADADTVDPRFLTCQRHSNPDAAPRLKHACMKFHKQEEERLRIMHRRLLTQREEKKRQRGLARHKKILKSLEGVSISWPENDIKRPKLLNTSPMFLDLFRDKAICAGFTHEQFERNFKRIDGADLSYLPPGFSHEFLSYFEAREKILPTERMRLKELETEAMNLRKQQAELEKELCELEKSISASNSNTSPQPRVQSPVREQRVLLSWYSTMVALGVKKIRKPFTGLSHELCSPSKQHRASKTPSSKPSTSTVSPSACARSKSVSNKRNGRISSGTSASNATKSNDISPISKSQPNTPIQHSLHASPPVCSICHKCTDQHLLVMCDICKNHYHLACLDPPLAKMPKKNRNCGWECSICAEHSGEEDEQSEEESDKEQSVRKLRDRTDMNEKRKEEEKAFKHAFRSAMASQRRRPIAKRRRSFATGERSNSMGASLPKRSLMTPLSVDVRDSRSGSPELVPNGVSLPLSSRSASNHSSCFSSPTPVPPHHQKRSRNCSTSQLLSPTRLNGSLLKLNGVRKGSAEILSRRSDIGTLKSPNSTKEKRRASTSSNVKTSSETAVPLAPNALDKGHSITNGLIAMVSPR